MASVISTLLLVLLATVQASSLKRDGRVSLSRAPDDSPWAQWTANNAKTVDLFIALTMPLDAPLIPDLVASIKLYWQERVKGKVIFLCVGCKWADPRLKTHFDSLTSEFEVHSIAAPTCLHSYVGHQWSNFEAVKYSNADFIAYMDSDGLFHAPISTSILLSDTGKSAMIARPGAAASRWAPALQKLLSVDEAKLQHLDFMAALPFIVRRDTVVALRQHVADNAKVATGGAVTTWDGAWCHHFAKITTLGEMPCDFCLMGTYAMLHESHNYRIVVEGHGVAVMRLVSHQGVDWSQRTCDKKQSCEPNLPCGADEGDSKRKLVMLGSLFQQDKGEIRVTEEKQRTAKQGRFLSLAQRETDEKTQLKVAGPLAQVDCFHRSVGNSTLPGCTHNKCHDILHPVLNWEQRNCWATKDLSLVEASMQRYMQVTGLFDDITQCRNWEEPASHVRGSGCSCGQLEALATKVSTVLTVRK